MFSIYIKAGLGNRLFMFAFAYAFAKKYNIKFHFKYWYYRSYHTRRNYDEIVQRFINSELYYNEKFMKCDDIWYQPINDVMNYLNIIEIIPEVLTKNILIRGFFMNELYFNEFRDDILYLYREPETITSLINIKYINNINYIENSYFIHVRLGDFIKDEVSWVDLSNYYIKCIEQIHMKDANATFSIFSNQIHLIQQIYPMINSTLKLLNMKYIIIDEKDELVAFYLIKRCNKGGICANSTFSWWASWLNININKQVYMPSKWFSISDNHNICPTYAIIVDV